MSEQQYSTTHTSDSMREADAFHLQQAEYWIGKLQFGDQPLRLTSWETVELMSVEQEEPTVVLRQRHNAPTDEHCREDVYFAFHLGKTSLESSLVLLTDGLQFEEELIDKGEFEKIGPRRQALARRAALGSPAHPDTQKASHDNLREFLRLLHAAASITQQK